MKQQNIPVQGMDALVGRHGESSGSIQVDGRQPQTRRVGHG